MRRTSVRGLTLLVVLALCTTACASARHLREAQNAFNEAARVENQERAMTLAGGASPASTSAASGYRTALTLLNQELAQHRSDLQRERLLGSALMLKALSLWRVADLDEDAKAGEELTRFLGEVRTLSSAKGDPLLGTRDQVLLYALPGLRDHDLGLRAPSLDTARRYFDSSVTVLDRALETVQPPPNHPVRVYIRLSQLATLRAWKGAVYVFESEPGRRAAQVEPLLVRFRTVAKTLEPSVSADPILRGVVCSYHQAMGLTC